MIQCKYHNLLNSWEQSVRKSCYLYLNSVNIDYNYNIKKKQILPAFREQLAVIHFSMFLSPGSYKQKLHFKTASLEDSHGFKASYVVKSSNGTELTVFSYIWFSIRRD